MKDIENTTSFPLNPSTIEDIDASVLEWLQAKNLFTTTNEGWRQVPVVWVSEERSHQVKSRKEIRDKSGAIILPAVSVERTAYERDLKFKGSFTRSAWPQSGYDPRGGMIAVTKRVMQDKTANFQNADSEYHYNQANFPRKKSNKVVYETFYTPMPIYLTVHYEVSIATEYQQQMNELVQPFMTDGFGLNWIRLTKNGHIYEGFIEDDFAQKNNGAALGQDRRLFETTIKLKVLGYLLGAGPNEERPHVIRRESAAEFKITGERTSMLKDVN